MRGVFTTAAAVAEECHGAWYLIRDPSAGSGKIGTHDSGGRSLTLGPPATVRDAIRRRRSIGDYDRQLVCASDIAFSRSVRAAACVCGTASIAARKVVIASLHDPFAARTRASVSRTMYESGPCCATAFRASDSASS